MNSFEATISETQHRFEEFFKSEFEKLKQTAKQEVEHHQAKQIPEDAIIFELEGNKCKLASSSISFLKSPLNEDFDGILPPAEGWDRNGEQLALLTQYLIQGTWNTVSVSSILGASLTKKIESRGFTIQIKTPPISEEKRSKIKEKISVFERGAKNPSRPPPAQVPPPGKTKRRGSQYENIAPTSPQMNSTDDESSSKEREPIVDKEEKQEERKTDQKEKEDKEREKREREEKEREKREREEKEKKESQVVEKKVENVIQAKSNETTEKYEINGELKHNEKEKQKEREREENLRKEKEERERKEKERKEKEESERKERERKEKEERERKEREEKEKKEREEKERKEKEEREKKEMEEKQKKEKEKKPEKAEQETKKKKDKKSKKEEKKENSKPSEKKPEEKSKIPSSKVKVNVGAFSEQGTRPYNEDTFTVIESLRADPTTSFFGVFDGHGGLNASTLCSKKMHENIVSQSCYKTDKKKAIIDGFIQTDRDYREKFPEGEDGSTAVIALLTEDYKLYVGHVGDSRILVSQNGVARPLTKDHKVNNQTEINRIEKAGHHVEADIEYVDETNEYVETYRVDGELAVSRAIGDLNYKDYEGGPEDQAVTCIPEVSELTVNKGDFLVLACDGLWDVVEHQNVADYIHDRRKRGKSMQVISEQLVKDAIEIGSQDNVTVIIVEII